MGGTTARMGVLRAWGNAVGREAALDGLAAHRLAFRSEDAAATALGMSKSSLHRLRDYFKTLHSSEPAGLALFLPSTVGFLSRALIESLLAGLIGHEAEHCQTNYQPLPGGGAVIRLTGLPDQELLQLAVGLERFFGIRTQDALQRTIAQAVEPAVARAVEAAVSDTLPTAVEATLDRSVPNAVEAAIEDHLPSIVASSLAPLATIQAQLGARISAQIDSLYASMERIEIKLSEEVVEGLQALSTEVLESALEPSAWRLDLAAGKLVRQGGWAIGTGAAGSGLVELIKLLASG